MNLPTLKDLGVRIHSDISYGSGDHEDCAGELQVMATFGRKDEWVELECKKCQASVSIPNVVAPDKSWQERADLA